MSEEVIDVLKNIQQEMNNASSGLFERLKNIEIENGNLKQKNKQLKDKLEFYSGLELDKTIDKTRLEYNKLQQENKKYKEVIEKLKEWINIVQQNKDNKHLEPFISTDELDELLDILKEVE